jgi:hypothetical protein
LPEEERIRIFTDKVLRSGLAARAASARSLEALLRKGEAKGETQAPL